MAMDSNHSSISLCHTIWNCRDVGLPATLPLCAPQSEWFGTMFPISPVVFFFQQVYGQTFGVCTTNDQVLQTLLLICHMFSWF